MHVEYDADEKQLKIIPANQEEHNELTGLAKIMRHGDICSIGLADAGLEILRYFINGAVIVRTGHALTFNLRPFDSPQDSDSERAIDNFLDGKTSVDCLVYLWCDEGEGGATVLVFQHS
ncbi:MAG: hypothetical protein WCT26_01460 [Candidatus Buchananbacteria bacterium]|jgi:hypothetical protein